MKEKFMFCFKGEKMTIQKFGLIVLALTILFPVMSIGFEVIGEQRITRILKHFIIFALIVILCFVLQKNLTLKFKRRKND